MKPPGSSDPDGPTGAIDAGDAGVDGLPRFRGAGAGQDGQDGQDGSAWDGRLGPRLEALFGPGWRRSAADALGLRRESLWRYVSDPSPPPAEVVLALACWEALAARGVAPPATPDSPFPALDADDPAQAVVEGPTLAATLEAAFGPRWRGAACRAFGVSAPTLWRYCAFAPLPGPFRAALRALVAVGADAARPFVADLVLADPVVEGLDAATSKRPRPRKPAGRHVGLLRDAQ